MENTNPSTPTTLDTLEPATPPWAGPHHPPAPSERDPASPAQQTPATDHRPTRVIALMNQKGGVGKTTTTVNLGAALCQQGKRVLLVDLDPQSHLTLHVGINPEELEASVYDLLTQPDVSAGQIVMTISDRLAVLPAEINLAGAESELAPLAADGHAQHILRAKCTPLISDGQWFDYVLIDCPPSLGLLTINALALATEVFVPMQAHFLALQGLSKLLESVSLIQQSINPALTVTGIILCMHESQTVLASEVCADLHAFLEQARDTDTPWRDAQILQPPIRRNIKLAESPSFGSTIYGYAPNCPGAADYLALADCVIHSQASHARTNHPAP